MTVPNPDLIERATLALVNSRRKLHGLSPIDRMPWAATSDMERRHVAAALSAVADDLRAEGTARGFRSAAQLLDEMAPRPLEALRLAASILRGLADVPEGAVQCPTCADADRYAANEAEQREAAEPDPLDSSRDYDEHERAAEPDPLDENDHRDRLDCDGDRLIDRAVKAERVRLTAQLRQATSSVQDSGNLAELDALADEWEAL